MPPAVIPAAIRLERLPRRAAVCRTPTPVAGEQGLFVVDATWGSIAPLTLAPGVETVGELEVLEHLRGGGQCVDTRQPGYYAEGTLPGTLHIPYADILARRGELADVAVLFCNGPQCAATPKAVARLLAAGHPPSALLYYRGGIHDWVTLGLPLWVP